MNVSILQLATQHDDRAANFANAEAQIRLAMETQPDVPDVLVLPEMWDVGYPRNVAELGDPDGQAARSFLSAQAAQWKVNIVGGAIVRSQGGKNWNTAYVFDRQGQQLAAYDKIHLFSFGGEHNVFQPGDAPARYSLDNVPAGSVTCYDIRFCELVRAQALAGVQLLFVPAMWGKARVEHWRLLIRARAVENQMFVIGANMAETPGSGVSGGHSLIVDPLGAVLAEAGPEQTIIRADCSLDILRETRAGFTVLQDRRPELYGGWALLP